VKILQVITGLHKAAGTSVFCGEVANELALLGHDVTIAVCNLSDPDVYPLDPRIHLVSIESILAEPSTLQTLQTFSLVHIHALWTPILHRVSNWAHARSIPVVWSPHGMITPWAMKNKRLKKWLGWHLYQKCDLQRAALLHATAQSEVEDIRRMGLKNKVVVAPLGVRIQKSKCEVEERNGKTLLFVSRVQRKKGLPMLLDAWARLPAEIKKDWHIRIVGPDEGGHVAELMAQCDRLDLSYSPSHPSPLTPHLSPDVEFVGPKFGNDLTHEYASADLFVLPTHSENFGSVVIESLAQGVPVICTKGAPWEELETRHCGRWVDIGVEPLTAALSELLNLSDSERREMGERGMKLVEEKYTWEAVAGTMLKGYEGLGFSVE